MEEKAKLEIRRTQVIGYLAHGTVVKGASRLCLDHKFLVDNHVQSLTSHFLPFVSDGHGHFTIDLMATISQLAGKAGNINVFKETKSKRVINLEECSDDRIAQPFVNQLYTCHSYLYKQHSTTASPI